MKRFEYTRRAITNQYGDIYGGELEALNELGAEGWEMISQDQEREGNGYRFATFKREIEK